MGGKCLDHDGISAKNVALNSSSSPDSYSFRQNMFKQTGFINDGATSILKCQPLHRWLHKSSNKGEMPQLADEHGKTEAKAVKCGTVLNTPSNPHASKVSPVLAKILPRPKLKFSNFKFLTKIEMEPIHSDKKSKTQGTDKTQIGPIVSPQSKPGEQRAPAVKNERGE
jgi:hypothetical protein